MNLHLAERRRVGHTVTLERDGKAVSAAAVTDCGTRYGQISYVATLPEYEGQGYGRAVVYHCAGWLRKRISSRWWPARPTGRVFMPGWGSGK